MPKNALIKIQDNGPIIDGDVFIHPTAKVDPSAVLGKL